MLKQVQHDIFQHFAIATQSLAGGDEREGEEKGDVAPSPLPCGVKSSTPQDKPSPVKGEGEVAGINLCFPAYQQGC